MPTTEGLFSAVLLTLRNFQFLLILEATSDKSGIQHFCQQICTTVPAVVQIFTSMCQWRVHLIWKQMKEAARIDRH